MDIETFFSRCWGDYVAMAPQAQHIRAAFEQRGETVVNDHVAFRTLALEPIGLPVFERHVLELGYQPFAPYTFAEKKLRAVGYVPPREDLPRIFVSELLVEQLAPPAAAILRRCAAQVDPARIADPDLLWAGTLWDPMTSAEYETLLAQSEYAAWVATIGLRPNHFTISVNHLRYHPEVEDVLRVVQSLDYPINESGGRIKGSPAVLLEQASTMADRMPVILADGQPREVPTCYYEFAKRYHGADGRLFQGFVAGSADRIFESTDAKTEEDGHGR